MKTNGGTKLDMLPATGPSSSRREFMVAACGAILGAIVGCRGTGRDDELNAFIERVLRDVNAPGFCGAIVQGDRLLWSAGFGWADVRGRLPMSPDTVQNIGSISKTVTATAVMQLWEEERFQLDDDVSDHLPYRVRNPRFPDDAITFRQLLTHRSSITDGPAYGESYACGDPSVPLGEWVEAYLTPGGSYYDPDANFLPWRPGTEQPPTPPRAYSNVAFGLLGVLVESLSGQPFNRFCASRIFEPLGMSATGWLLTEVDRASHAVPHTLLREGFDQPGSAGAESQLPATGVTAESFEAGDPFPLCLYSFYNYPDGLLRTSVEDLSRFLRAYVLGGVLDGSRVLREDTVNLMLSREHYGHGLCWTERDLSSGDVLWGHGGSDPGVATYMGFRQRDDVGAILFFNFDSPGDGMSQILDRLMEEGSAPGRP